MTPCPICRGELWVCEDHPAEPWPHEGCDGAGSPCICNPTGAVQWREVYAEVPPDKPLQ